MPPPPAVHSARDLIGNTSLVELRQTGTGCCQLFLKLECPGHGLDLQADRADLKRAVRGPGYAAVTDNGRLVGAATALDLPSGTGRTPCETRR